MAFVHIAQDFSPASSLFKRCTTCPETAPTCPSCKSDEVCSQQLGDGCNTCSKATCVKAATSGSLSSTSSKDSGPNIGAIVGGVIGGVAFIAIVVFCVWKFWLKGRRHEVELEEEWEDEDDSMEKTNASIFTREARSRASTHTVASMASTVLTRASNIIQIAYIPGITNRFGNSDPNLLVPPVPPIPIATTPSSINSRFTDDQFLFMPSDLRDSTYSDMSAMTAMTDARRPGSIAPSLARTSVASTIYRDSAVVTPMPATQIIGGKAAIISVISKGSTPGSTPPVPSVDFAKHGGQAVKPVIIRMPSSDGSGSATSSLKTMKPVALNIIRKDKKNTDAASITSSTADSRNSKRMTNRSLAPSELSVDTHRRVRTSGLTHRSSHLTTYSDYDEEDDDHERSRQSLLERRAEATASPFTDAAEAKTPTTPTMPKDGLRVSMAGSGRDVAERGKSPFEDPESPTK